jgi:uncharacterized membrane protein
MVTKAGDEHTVHRLEAFSDIVIGFCIAEMGLNLLIPKTASALPSIVVGTNGFILSFVLISIVWWIHHRLFKSLFVLNPVTLILNFAMLGSLVLMVYLQQISLHLMAIGDRPETAVQLWLFCYSLVYALLAAMMWIGLWARWRILTIEDLRWGLSRAILTSVGTLAFIVSGVGFEQVTSARDLFIAAIVIVVTTRLVVPWAVDRFATRRA